MYIDKDLYRKAYEQYEQWNEADFVHRVRNAGKLSPEEAWGQYIALVEFLWRRCPEQSLRQQKQTMAEWEHYYTQIQRFEAWRQKHE